MLSFSITGVGADPCVCPWVRDRGVPVRANVWHGGTMGCSFATNRQHKPGHYTIPGVRISKPTFEVGDDGCRHRLEADPERFFIDVEPWMVMPPDETSILVLGADEEERAGTLVQEV